MREPKCLVCTDPATTVAVNELRAQGLSIRDVANRVKRCGANVDQHLRHAKISRGMRRAPVSVECPKRDATPTADPTNVALCWGCIAAGAR